MCYRQNLNASNKGAADECCQCGVKAANMLEEENRLFCERCYRARHKEQGADIFVPPPSFDIEEVGRQ